MTLLLPLLVFLLVVLLIGGVAVMLMSSRSAVAVDKRLREVTGAAEYATDEPAGTPQVVSFLQRVGEKVPRSTKELGKLRTRLVHAGFRRGEALSVFLAIRVGVAVLGFLVCATPLVMRPNLFLGLGAAGLGYLLTGMGLARMVKRRQHKIRLALADALDLLVVSVEAGLGLDQALLRVGQELAFAYPELADEFRLVNLELLAGTSRSDALRNLANRTGVDDLSSLVAMLVQTDKFGTSVANSLRVFSETLRTKRRQRAEEAAAKTGVKMVFPLVLCIFPAIWIVTIGPAAIQFVKVLFPLIEGGQ